MTTIGIGRAAIIKGDEETIVDNDGIKIEGNTLYTEK